MSDDDNNIEQFEEQHKLAEPVVRKFIEFVRAVRRSDLDTLHGIHDSLDVELMISHFHGAEKDLYRAATDLAQEEIERRQDAKLEAGGTRMKARLRLAAQRIENLFD